MQAQLPSRRGFIVLAVLAALLLAPAARADEAETIYDPGAMVEIDLGLSGEAEAKLEAEPFEDVKGTFSAWLDADGIPGGARTTLTENHAVEVRLKGHLSGSFRPLATGKSGFKLKFKKTERFLGLRKMTLNNMVEDTSMIHETLAYSLFRAAGVPASRTGYAYVRVNGEDFGVYLDLENLDETFLAAHYGAGNTLHLYEGEYGADADAASIATLGTEPPEGEPKFEMDEGEGEPTDLEALANAVAAASPAFATRLAGLADLAEMTRMWAVEKYVSHWDGYSGEEASNKPNNYYLHSDLGGLFQMLPWGTDNTWQIERRIGFDGPAGLLFNGCLGDAACFRKYYEALDALRGQVTGLDPDALAASSAALLKPWQELEEGESTRGEHNVGEIESAVTKVRQYIGGRPGELSAWLAAHKPPAEGPGTGSGGGPTPPVSASPPRLAGVVKHRRSVRLRLRVSGEGTLFGRAVFPTPEGRRRACSYRVAVEAPGIARIDCKFSSAVVRQLQRHGLKLTFLIRLRGASGEVERLTTVVRVRRG